MPEMLTTLLALCAVWQPFARADPCSIQGTTTISNYNEPTPFSSCKTITGSISLERTSGDAPASDTELVFELHDVERINGSISIKNNPVLKQLRLPKLKHVDMLRIYHSDGIVNVDAPELTSVGEVLWHNAVNFEGLNSGSGITDVDRITIRNTSASSLSAFKPTSLEYLWVSGNSNMTKLSIPELSTARLRVAIENNGPGLEISFPRLHSVGSLGVSGLGSSQVPGTATLDLPSLRSSGDFAIMNNAQLGGVSVPKLGFVSGYLIIHNNPKLERIPLDNLYHVTEYISYRGSFFKVSAENVWVGSHVTLTTDQRFDCSKHSRTGYKSWGKSYFCSSANSFVERDGSSYSYAASTPTPTPTPASRGSSSNDHQKHGLSGTEKAILIAIVVSFFIVVSGFGGWRQKRRASKIGVPVANKNRDTNSHGSDRVQNTVEGHAEYDPPPAYTTDVEQGHTRPAQPTVMEKEYRDLMRRMGAP